MFLGLSGERNASHESSVKDTEVAYCLNGNTCCCRMEMSLHGFKCGADGSSRIYVSNNKHQEATYC